MTRGDQTGRRLAAALNPGPGGIQVALATVVAVALALAVSSALVGLTGGSPGKVVQALYDGSLANSAAVS
ncbi:hypothetical protein EMG21_34095, partial [Klebsiella pneumoniae]